MNKPTYVKTCDKCYQMFITNDYERRLCAECATNQAKYNKEVHSKW